MDDDEGDDIIEDDESDSDGADGGYNFHNLLTAWAVTWGIKQNALDALFVICRLFEWGMSLPKFAVLC
jgi:hypothetical protein